MKKRRLSFRLENDEALVIAPVEFWEQVKDHFLSNSAEFPEYKEDWIAASDHIDEWLERTRDKRTEIS